MMKFVAFFCVFLVVVQNSESKPTYQFLPPRAGYVPVYIRLGDTPLNEINPSLAVAFHENDPVKKIKSEEDMQNDQSIPIPNSSSSEGEISDEEKINEKKEEILKTIKDLQDDIIINDSTSNDSSSDEKSLVSELKEENIDKEIPTLVRKRRELLNDDNHSSSESSGSSSEGV